MKAMKSNYANRSLNKKIKGSITVEAAFIMPLIILVIFSIVYLSFYLHDYCKLQGTVDLVLHKAIFSAKHKGKLDTGEVDYENINNRGIFYPILGDKGEMEEQIREYMNLELAKGLFLYQINHINVEVGTLSIQISLEGKTRVSLPGLLHIKAAQPILEKQFYIHNPGESIRISEVLLTTAERIKGLESIKKGLEKIINKNR
ncbi:MAG TPA: pilus assembly protein [Clostridiales bacterium]|nr:pilus assembly protein [Clostridiales bacterium]